VGGRRGRRGRPTPCTHGGRRGWRPFLPRRRPGDLDGGSLGRGQPTACGIKRSGGVRADGVAGAAGRCRAGVAGVPPFPAVDYVTPMAGARVVPGGRKWPAAWERAAGGVRALGRPGRQGGSMWARATARAQTGRPSLPRRGWVVPGMRSRTERGVAIAPPFPSPPPGAESGASEYAAGILCNGEPRSSSLR
jgi:hypothetical protein